MAFSRLSLVTIVFLLSLVVVIEVSSVIAVDVVQAAYRPMGGPGSVKAEDCEKACEYRCSATSHKKPCMFFCVKCCTKCLCVPSGTYGHKEECPCYNDWKTQDGKPKCP
ncbi:hypothetical protein Scep_010456 [Stephania cephalantha]|uniref:Uncharacterized protein n=1 Tax=Stephania cephalantha TaxID=152367 RepID=A0AAP0JXB0_9MAGN